MTLSAVKPGGWSLNEVLTSLQMTQLQDELLKAVDGVNGGAYTLVAGLTFQGADVTFNSDINLNPGAELHFNSGADLTGDVDVDGDMTFVSGSTLTMAAGSSLSILGSMTLANVTVTTSLALSSATLSVDSASSIDMLGASSLSVAGAGLIDLLGSLAVRAGGSIDVTSGGDINVTSADVNILGGAQVLLNGGGLIVGATGFIQANGGDITLGSGSVVTLGSGASILGQNGSTVTVDDPNDLLVNGGLENWRLALTPFFIQLTTGGDPRWKMDVLGKWRQQDATTGGYPIGFALPLPPGDVVTALNMFINGGAGGGLGHNGVLPGILPSIEVVKLSFSGTLTTVAKTVDTTSSAATYDTGHLVTLDATTVTVGAIPFTISSDPHYIVVRGEQGGVDNMLELVSIFGQCQAHSFRGTGGAMVYS